jgi:hypothetical protein
LILDRRILTFKILPSIPILITTEATIMIYLATQSCFKIIRDNFRSLKIIMMKGKALFYEFKLNYFILLVEIRNEIFIFFVLFVHKKEKN